ncbi:hypothetical protein HZC09_07030, partial [Candidatus Micrarchaeota archaeon]|nr:hypothetical protein [Candidatus Micrarchaeota archaeon]
MTPTRLLVETIKRIQTGRVDRAVNNLLENPRIRAAVNKETALKHVLRAGIASGKLPERNGEKNALQLIEYALLAGRVAEKLEQRTQGRVGKPPKAALNLQETLAEYTRQHPTAKTMLNDKNFSAYLKNMGLTLHRQGYAARELEQNPLLAHAVLDHVTTEYQLMQQVGVPASIIKKYGHAMTVFQADQVYKDATKTFGEDEESKPLVRTAAFQLFMKKYSTIQEAKKAYDKHLKDATTTFGEDPEAQPLIRTAAYQLFTKKYSTIQEAKKAYDKHLKDATTTFGEDPEAQPLI